MKKYIENNYGALIFATLGIATVPTVLYFYNAKDFNNDISLLVLPLILAVSVLIINGLGNFITKRLSSRFNQINCYIQSMLSFAGLAVLLSDLIFPKQLHVLDGTTSSIIADLKINFIELAGQLLLFIFIIIFSQRLKKILMFTSLVSVVYLLSLFSMNFISSFQEIKENMANRESHTIQNKNIFNAKKITLPNVYLIWLDAMQTDYYLKYIEESKTQNIFKDFTLFKNNTANYLYTEQSSASFMSGTIYKGGDYNNWAHQDSLRRLLKQQGYKITSYATSRMLSSLDDRGISAEEIFQETTNNPHPLITDFVTSWVARSVPTIILNPAVKLSKRFISYVSRSKFAHVHSIEDGMYPISAVYTLNKLAEDEEKRSDAGELIIAQAILPHGPYVIASDCSYKVREKWNESSSEKYYAQTSCAASLTAHFLNQLKTLQRYDSSLIVIFGDHGRDEWPPISAETPLEKNYLSWSKQTLQNRVSALLMIKPPNHTPDHHDLIISNQESQLIDLYPTIAHLLGFSKELNDVDGKDLYAQTKTPPREKYFVYFKPCADPDWTDAKTYSLSYNAGLFDIHFRSNFKAASGLANRHSP
jgi:hypothetical protein